jgi:hypothetical protein
MKNSKDGVSRRTFLKNSALTGGALAVGGFSGTARAAGPARTLPMLVVDRGVVDHYFSGLQIYWGDIHGHTAFSDGWGTPEQFYDYARNTQNLAFSAVTDHVEAVNLFSESFIFADGSPLDLWRMTIQAADAHYVPGTFVTLPAFEWTSNEFGHRNAYFRNSGDVPPVPFDSNEYRNPNAWWQALRPYEVFTASHHPVRMDTPTNWDYGDPDMERLVEIYSKWGNSESPWATYEPYYHMTAYPWTRLLAFKHAMKYMLDKGHRLGVIAGTDTHQGMPGSTTRTEDAARGPVVPVENYASMTAEDFMQVVQNGYTHVDRGGPEPTGGGPAGGGLAGVWAHSLTRENIWDALYDRHTAGSTGVRPLVQFAVEDTTAAGLVAGIMGDEITVAGYPRILGGIECEAGCTVHSAELMKDGVKIAGASPAAPSVGLRFEDTGLAKGSTSNYVLRLVLKQNRTDNLDSDSIQWYHRKSGVFYEPGPPQTREIVWTSPIWVTRRA